MNLSFPDLSAKLNVGVNGYSWKQVYLYPTCKYLPPAYVVRREGNSFTLLVCPHLGGSVSWLSRGGVSASRGEGQPARGGSASQGGQPAGGWGSASRGGSASWGGGVSQDRTTEWVLTTQRAVCLLRSRRRTFLLCFCLLDTVELASDCIYLTQTQTQTEANQKHKRCPVWLYV